MGGLRSNALSSVSRQKLWVLGPLVRSAEVLWLQPLVSCNGSRMIRRQRLLLSACHHCRQNLFMSSFALCFVHLPGAHACSPTGIPARLYGGSEQNFDCWFSVLFLLSWKRSLVCWCMPMFFLNNCPKFMENGSQYKLQVMECTLSDGNR